MFERTSWGSTHTWNHCGSDFSSDCHNLQTHRLVGRAYLITILRVSLKLGLSSFLVCMKRSREFFFCLFVFFSFFFFFLHPVMTVESRGNKITWRKEIRPRVLLFLLLFPFVRSYFVSFLELSVAKRINDLRGSTGGKTRTWSVCHIFSGLGSVRCCAR